MPAASVRQRPTRWARTASAPRRSGRRSSRTTATSSWSSTATTRARAASPAPTTAASRSTRCCRTTRATPNGGNGFLRYFEFDPANNRISAFTYSPVLGQYETDTSSQFTLAYDMGGGSPFQVIGTRHRRLRRHGVDDMVRPAGRHRPRVVRDRLRWDRDHHRRRPGPSRPAAGRVRPPPARRPSAPPRPATPRRRSPGPRPPRTAAARSRATSSPRTPAPRPAPRSPSGTS